MLVAGRVEEIVWGSGNWVFLDIGFSKGRTCGIAFGDEEPVKASFAEAVRELLRRIPGLWPEVNLVIEAPLSAAFDSLGNPTGRSIERESDGRTRYWYIGAGCVVMTAAMYLLRSLDEGL